MPNSVLEALACGVPVVSSNVGGVPYLVEHGKTALLVEPGDAEAMAAALARLHTDPSLCRALRDAGLEMVAGFSWPTVKNAWLGLYRSQVIPA